MSETGVIFTVSAQVGGCFVEVVLILVVGLAIVAVVVGLMVRMDRVNRRRVERRREAWKAAGAVEAYPDDYIGRGYIAH